MNTTYFLNNLKESSFFKEINGDWPGSFLLDNGDKRLVNIVFSLLPKRKGESQSYKISILARGNVGFERIFEDYNKASIILIDIIKGKNLSYKKIKSDGFKKKNF